MQGTEQPESFTWQPMRKLSVALLLMTLGAGSAFAGNPSDSDNETSRVMRPATPVAKPEATYAVSAGLDGEIYPFFANYASLQKPQARQFSVVTVTVTNSSDTALHNRIAVRVPGWSDQEIQMVELAAGQVKTLRFAPTFLPRLYKNKEIAAATAAVEVTDTAGRSIYETTVPIHLRSVDDIFWGSNFKNAAFIASWVTPHDLNVENILGKAKELMPGRRLPGYEPWKDSAQQEQSTFIQAKAIYNALKKSGVSYVKSSITFGGNSDWSERVRMPRESLGQSSANCIDAAVVYASLFENLGMDPIVVLVPGHAYVGVRVAKGSPRYLFIDSALTGRYAFDYSVKSAERGLAKYDPSDITRIPIDEARDRGIFPLPSN